MHTKNEALAPSCLDAQRASTFRSSGEPLDRSPSLPKLGPSSSAGNDHQAADGEDDATHASAADEAEPSLVDAPIIPTPLLTRKPIRVKRLVEVPTPHTARQQVRLLRSRVTSSLSQWGNAVSRFVHRPAIPEGNGAINPYFDPWEGYVPPRGPSPDGIVPNDALETPKSSIWNIYVKLDE
ncbi:hypothetical protein FS837_004910 [Tulasnella sp. UAMH 9824]|nr:hypothetical protein FS837_004910 [Tulasnella sp. UAMH 9824]